MPGCLEDLFNVRTNGNGCIRSEWDDILLKQDLKRLLEQGQLKTSTWKYFKPKRTLVFFALALIPPSQMSPLHFLVADHP
jgi:hypothetical protein